MGLLSRITGRFARSDAGHRGPLLEAQGRMEEAYEAYIADGKTDQAARVLLVRAESTTDPTQRLALLGIAASRAPKDSELLQTARKSAALLRLDMARNAHNLPLRSELADLARQFEQLNMPEHAAESYNLAGDTDNLYRVLAESGSIDALEKLHEKQRLERSLQRERENASNKARDLNAIGARLDCISLCEQWLSEHPEYYDDAIATLSRSVKSRLVQTGIVSVRMGGEPMRLSVDHPFTIGRSGTSLELPSVSLSRRHLQVQQTNGQVVVQDLRSRNGTWLAGAKIDGQLPIGSGMELRLGNQTAVCIEPWRCGAKLSLAGHTIAASLGPLSIAGFVVQRAASGTWILSSNGSPPVLNGLTANSTIELCYGDRIYTTRGGPIVFQVEPQ